MAIFIEIRECIGYFQKAVVLGSLMMIDRMGKHKGGKGGVIVNTASILGLKNIGMPIYCSTKHAVVSFTRCMNV